MNRSACLIIHGFGGSTKEIDYLSGYLKNKGLDVYCVLLAGHGGSKKDLAKTNASHWLASVESKLDELNLRYSRVCVIGFSMGGLLAMRFACRPEVQKIILIHTPVYFWNLKIILKDVFNGVTGRNPEVLKYYAGSVCGISIKSGVDFLVLLFGSKKYMRQIQIPCLILQCKTDESVYYKSAYFLGKHIHGAEIKLYEGGRHQVFKIPELRDRLCEAVYCWLNGANPNN